MLFIPHLCVQPSSRILLVKPFKPARGDEGRPGPVARRPHLPNRDRCAASGGKKIEIEMEVLRSIDEGLGLLRIASIQVGRYNLSMTSELLLAWLGFVGMC